MMVLLNNVEKVRKKSRFLAAKEVEKALVEGIWKLVHLVVITIVIMIIVTIILFMINVIDDQEANRNYEEYLAAIGTGPCSQDMVMRADVKLSIEQVAATSGMVMKLYLWHY